jgi:hypothetical protein
VDGLSLSPSYSPHSRDSLGAWYNGLEAHRVESWLSRPPSKRTESPATDDDTLLPFSLPIIRQKKITAAFDGGLILLTEEGHGTSRALSPTCRLLSKPPVQFGYHLTQ